MDNIQPDNIQQKSDKKYRDTFFRTLFHDYERALELCNAIEDTNFPSGTPLQFFSRGDIRKCENINLLCRSSLRKSPQT